MMPSPIDPDEFLADANLPPNIDEVKNIVDDDTTWFMLDEGYEVYGWFPLPDAQGGPTQVHVTFRNRSLGMGVVIRLKSARAVNELIAAVRRHRDEVWP